jgi:hypothetical protein
LPQDTPALAISLKPSASVLASRPEISRMGDGPEDERLQHFSVISACCAVDPGVRSKFEGV